MSVKEHVKAVSGPVYVVVMLFGISSWIDINGVFVEAPLFVNVLPEGWNLFSYLSVIIQIANIGPIIYTILKKSCPDRVEEWPVVYIIIGIGATALMLLAFFWHETTFINGEEHSTALFTLTAFLALVDCTSSVVYLPYMAQFKVQYMTAYFMGEGLSAMLPGMVGLIQGVESEPNCLNQSKIVMNETTGENSTLYEIVAEYPPPLFSVQVFFFFLFGMMVVSGTSFTVLHFHPYCRKERVSSAYSCDISGVDNLAYKVELPSTGIYRAQSLEMEVSNDYSAMSTIGQNETVSEGKSLRKPSVSYDSISPESGQGKDVKSHLLTNGQFGWLLFLTSLMNALLNGVIPSTQTYTCLPYGSQAYTLAVRLASVANPLVCLLALFVRTTSVTAVSVLAGVATGLTGWHLYLAAMSPNPPLKDTEAGTALVIVTQIVCTACIVYVDVTNASMFNLHGGAKSLLYGGIVTQVGSLLGAVITFVFVNVLQVFESEPACPGMTW